MAGTFSTARARRQRPLYQGRVRSAAVDADGDTLTDFQEKTYGLNPNHASNATVLSMESVVQENGAAIGRLRPPR